MCVSACPRQRDGRGGALAEPDWCGECQDEHAAYVEDQGRLASLARAAEAFDAIPPATDEELRRRLNDVAPLVEDLAIVPESACCPLCGGGKSIRVFSREHGHLEVVCPWCGGIGLVPDLPDWQCPDLSERRMR